MSESTPDRGRSLVQRCFFVGETSRVDPALYAVSTGAAVRRERDVATLAAGARLSADTYFGRFAASYWQRYTAVDAVAVEFDYECADGASLTASTRASDVSGRERPLTVCAFDGAGSARIAVDVDRYLDGGAAWLDLVAEGGEVTVARVRWTTAVEPVRDRPVSVVICTFNRPSDAVTTASSVLGDAELAERVETLHLVDQGTDHVSDDPGFADLEELASGRLEYVRQANLGGSGGFSRGMYEATATGVAVTDVLLMDDDILCEPESMLRMTSFARHAAEPVLVGAQMLLLSETTRIHMTAETDALDTMDCMLLPPHAHSGVDAREFRQDRRVAAGYNGWWSCLIPREAIDAVGLPLPFFIKWDDIEYAVRCRGAGFRTVTLPNAGVWHADFHLKDDDEWAAYFGQRNALVSSAIHGRFDGRTIAKIVATHIGETIVALKYGQAAAELRGTRDFLAGPQGMVDGGRDVLAEVTAARRGHEETVVQPAAVIGDAPVVPGAVPPQPRWKNAVLAKRAAQQALGRVLPGRVAMDADGAGWWHVGRFASAVVTDASQTGVRVRTFDRGTALAQGRELASLCFELATRAPEIQRAWRDAVPQLTSRANWEKLFVAD